MIDRGVTALRTLRPDIDGDLFWFRDDLHQPYPISPMGMSTIQKHHAWGYHVAAEETQLPPSKGAYVKMYKGKVYLGFALIEDEEEIGRRAAKFGKLVEYVKNNWDEYYNERLDEVKANLKALSKVNADELNNADLLAHVKQAEEFNRRNWEIHFILMYPADTVYLEFEGFCTEHGMEEKEFVSLLKGFESMPSKTDEELWNLAVMAKDAGLQETVLSTPTASLIATLEANEDASDWLKRLNDFLDVHGNRISAAHLDVIYPTWKEDPSPVLETIKSYFKRMEDGWQFNESRKGVIEHREEAISAFEEQLDDEAKKTFRALLEPTQKVYAYQEDHGFFIDQGSTAALHYALMACGRRLQKLGLLEAAEDVFFLTYSELIEVLDDISRNEQIGVYHHIALVPPLIVERKEYRKQAEEADAPLTIGNVPSTMTDPIAIKVFGIIDEVLHPRGEKEVVERLEGFAGAPGVVKGPARVIMHFDQFPNLESGEVLVCPYTSTAWTPLFLKISGVVTDTGGMLTHAAIAAREYGIPAVVGTWNATNSIRDGDIVEVNGDKGVVEILERAESPMERSP